MINARITSLKETSAPASAMAIPGEWPGPTVSDSSNLAQIVVGE